jgi:hypothetical protein
MQTTMFRERVNPGSVTYEPGVKRWHLSSCGSDLLHLVAHDAAELCERLLDRLGSLLWQLRQCLLQEVASVSGTQIHPSCCSGGFVDQSAESVAAVELVRRMSSDGA